MPLEAAKEVLDAPSMAIETLVKRPLVDALAAGRKAGKDAHFVELTTQRIGSVTLVPEQGGALTGIEPRNEIGCLDAIRCIASAELQNDRSPESVRDGMDLCRQAAAALRATHRSKLQSCETTFRL